MRIAELAFASYVYSGMSNYDDSYIQFLRSTAPSLDLSLPQHQTALLEWLNDWGCRQFAKDYHSAAALEVAKWYKKHKSEICAIKSEITSLTPTEYRTIERVYADIVSRTACRKPLQGGRWSTVQIGPTGASKILFALCPRATIPWDSAMRAKFELDGSAQDYVLFLHQVRKELQSLRLDCAKHGIKIRELPAILGKPKVGLAKLVDEFHWVTISRNCPAPSDIQARRWASWI